MLTAVLEILFALLACVGLMYICWLLFGRCLRPCNSPKAFTLIPATGTGAELEQTLRGLLWLRQWDLWEGNILIADCGLTEEGKQLAHLLCANTPNTHLCDLREIPSFIHKEVVRHERPQEPPTQ